MTAQPQGSDLDAARHEVAERGLTPTAVTALTEIVKGLPFESLTPVKTLLKRFFSDAPWTAADDDALADIIGTGTGSERVALDADLMLTWAWEHDRFILRVIGAGAADTTAPAVSEADLGLTFEADVVPEVTPSPRTIRFATPQLHTGASRFYSSAAEAAEDPRAARVFRDFDEVTNVLIGPDFVAVTIARADAWESVLAPMLRMIAEAFTGATPVDSSSSSARSTRVDREPADGTGGGATRRFERAWAELGGLRADQPADLARILTATRDAEPERRQVAAALLGGAPAVAIDAWNRLLDDDSRRVRRSVVDAVVDALDGSQGEALRPLLERALTDADAWTRWKALHGIATLGVATSREAVEARAADSDFRVRLEAARALAP